MVTYSTKSTMYQEDPILLSELNENSTRYDYIVAYPSDSSARPKVWISWTIVTAIVNIACLILILGISTSRRARSRSFNLYIVFLTLPDLVFSGLCMYTCLSNYIRGEYSAQDNPINCKFQAWYCVFGWTANMWMNAVISWRLLDLLRKSNKSQRYVIPPSRAVISNALSVYLYACFMASWTLLDIFPHRARPVAGVACLPTEYSRTSLLFFWIVFMPLMLGIPIGYVAWVVYVCHKKKLLPKGGKRRFLALYFLRLIVSFLVMWVPSIIFIYVLSAKWWWTAIFGGTWSHMQGLVSAIMCLQKPDIAKAVKDFLRCDFQQKSTNRRNSFRVARMSWNL